MMPGSRFLFAVSILFTGCSVIKPPAPILPPVGVESRPPVSASRPGRSSASAIPGHRPLFRPCRSFQLRPPAASTTGLDFETHTRETLRARTGDWILNSAVKGFLHDRLRFDLGAQLRSVLMRLHAAGALAIRNE